jgi:tellurite resistance protein
MLPPCCCAGPLNGGIGSDSLLSFEFMSRLLYLLSLSLAFLLGLLFLTGHASRLKFEVSSWSLAFPLEALALSTLMYAAAIPGNLTNGMAYAALAVASAAVAVLALHTLQSLLMGGIFVQVGGWVGGGS